MNQAMPHSARLALVPAALQIKRTQTLSRLDVTF